MSGRRIDDHKFFAGSGSPRFPKGVHTKDESSAYGNGAVMRYEDTTEAIKYAQEETAKKAYKQKMKPGYRY